MSTDMSTDISTDISVEHHLICRPTYRPTYRSRGAQTTHDPDGVDNACLQRGYTDFWVFEKYKKLYYYSYILSCVCLIVCRNSSSASSVSWLFCMSDKFCSSSSAKMSRSC